MASERSDAGGGEALERFLAAQDVPCPACGYNLRGVAAERCPECGEGLRLEIVGTGGGAGWRGGLGGLGARLPREWLFLLLAFGWVLAAGTMNLVRSGTALMEEWRYAQTMPRFAYGVTVQPNLGVGGGGGMRIFATQGTPAGGGGGAWWERLASLSWVSWSRTIWAAGLVLLAVAGLYLMLRVQRAAEGKSGAARQVSARPLVAYAWAVFALYAGWHFVLFGREVLGL